MAGSQGSAMERKRRGSRPRAGRRRFNLAPPFHHRGLRKPGYAYGGDSTSQATVYTLGVTAPGVPVQMLSAVQSRCDMSQTCVHLLSFHVWIFKYCKLCRRVFLV